MTPLLDTSVVVRYLTGEPVALAARAARIIDQVEETLAVSGVVLVEAAHVLTSVHGIPRAEVVDSLVQLLQRRNLVPLGLDKGAVIQGLLLCRPSKRVSFADALVWAAARSSGAPVVYSFDERFPAHGIEVLGDRR